jgi:cobalamin biosynthesis protein CobC
MDDLVHGGALGAMARAFPDAPLPWVDLSTGINPWPYHVGAITPGAWQKLPDSEAVMGCVDALSSLVGCAPSTVVMTPGSTAAMVAIRHAFNIDHIATITPTYGGYGEVFANVSAAMDLDAAIATNAKAIILGNPNNPDGVWQNLTTVQALAARLAATGRWLIIDEAFGDIAPHKCVAALAGVPGLLVLRSFGKFYGLAGLRLGAVLGAADAIGAIKSQLGAWPVSGPALEIGARAYADTVWQKQMMMCLHTEAAKLDNLLTEAGLERAGGTALFRLVRTHDAHAIWSKLAQAGIYVRRFGWSEQLLRFGLPPDIIAFERLASALQAQG